MYNHHLDTFLCAADLGSFSRAAEELYVSPNAVMKQINLLESHLELQLFIRDNHGLRLTPAGEVVYREAKAISRRSKKPDPGGHVPDAARPTGHRIVAGGTRPVPGHSASIGVL